MVLVDTRDMRKTMIRTNSTDTMMCMGRSFSWRARAWEALLQGRLPAARNHEYVEGGQEVFSVSNYGESSGGVSVRRTILEAIDDSTP